MSQSDKSDKPKKPQPSIGEGSLTTSEGPSADGTEEQISAVNQFFGIGSDSTTINNNEKVGNDTRNTPASNSKSVSQNPTSANIHDDSSVRKVPETSKTHEKTPASPVNGRSARDPNPGRVLTKGNTERQGEQKLPGLDGPSLETTESTISAVNEYFGIGQDDKSSQSKMNTNVRNEQIVAASQVVGQQDNSITVKKQPSGSKTSDTKVPSTVIAKQKSSPETSSSKGATNKTQITEMDGGENQRIISQKGSERVSNDPTESLVSAVKQQFGIGLADSVVVTKKTTSEGNENINEAPPNLINNVDETKKHNRESITMGSKVSSIPQKNIISESEGENVMAAQNSSRKMSQQKIGTNNDTNDSRNVKEITPKRVSIVESVMTSEGVVPIVTDTFGISSVTQSTLASKTSERLPTDSSREQETGSRSLHPVQQNDPEVTSYMNTTSDPEGKSQQQFSAPVNEVETPRTAYNDKVTSSETTESKVFSDPNVLSKSITIAAASQTPAGKTKSSSMPGDSVGSIKETPTMIHDQNEPYSNIPTNPNVSSTVEALAIPPTIVADKPEDKPKTKLSSTPGVSIESTKETPTTIHEQNEPYSNIPTNSNVSSIIEASAIPSTTIAADKPIDLKTRNESLSLTNSNEPRKIDTKFELESRIFEDQNEADTVSGTPSVVAAQSPPVQQASNGRESSKIHPSFEKIPTSDAAKIVESPNIMENQGIDAAKTQDFTDRPIPAVFTTSTPGIVDAQSYEKSRNMTAATSDGVKVASLSKESASQITSINETVSGHPARTAADKVENNSSLEAPKKPISEKQQQVYGSPASAVEESITSGPAGQSHTDESHPFPVSSLGQPQAEALNKTETPRIIDDIKTADSTRSYSNMSSSIPNTYANISPVVVNAQTPGNEKNKIPSNTLKDQGLVGAVNTGASRESQYSKEITQQPTTNRMEVQQTLEDHKPTETTSAVKLATKPVPSSAAAQPLPVMDAQDRQQDISNKESSSVVHPPEIQSTEPPFAVPTVAVTGESLQPQPTSAAETLRTMEANGLAETTEPILTAVTGPSILAAQPSPVVGTQKNISEPSIGSKEPPKTTVTASTAATPETLRAMEEREPTGAASPKPSPPSPIAVTAQSPPVIVNAHDRTGATPVASRAVTGSPVSVPARGSRTSSVVTSKQCWICFATDEDELGLAWIQPCKCKGTTKWVHQSCLQMWVDEKLREHKEKKVACPQCKTEYLIYLPKANILVRSLDQVDNVIYRVCPFIAAGVVIGTFYWNAVTYGAIVMLQVAGSEGASFVTESFQPTVIIVGLPFIPLSLIVFRLFQWEDSLLHILRTSSHCIPFLHYLLPGHVVNESGSIVEVPPSTIISFQRVLAGALLTPVIAKLCGNIFFPSISSPIWKTISGGALFIGVKGLVKMYHKQQNYKRMSKRKILDYTDENKRLIEQSIPLTNQMVPTPLRFQFVASVENRRTRRR